MLQAKNIFRSIPTTIELLLGTQEKLLLKLILLHAHIIKALSGYTKKWYKSYLKFFFNSRF